jgi:uncharacterized RDD family membrane protein YckC
MKPAGRNFLVIIVALLLFGATTPPGAPPTSRALHAWGTKDYFWSADSAADISADGAPGVVTKIRVRKAGDQLQWQDVGELAEMPVSLSNRGSELLIVLDDGEWKIASETDIRSGIDLPDNAHVLAVAGDGDDIWAVGGLDLTRDVTTQPTTNPTTLKSAPTTRRMTIAAPATRDTTNPPHPLALFLLHGGAWKRVDDVPLEYKPEQIAACSLAVLDDTLTMAIVGPDRAIRLYTRTADRWSKPIDIDTFGDNAQLKLLDVRGKPALWLADVNSEGSLYHAESGWKHPVKLAPAAKLKNFDRRSLAFSLGQLRLLASDGKGRLSEQLYEPTGKLQGEPKEALTGPTDAQKRAGQIIRFIVLAAFVIWMLGSLRQRPNVVEALNRIEVLRIAPLHLRLIGGVIDLIPLIVGCALSFYFVHRADEQARAQMDLSSPAGVCAIVGIAIYLFHTTLTEVLTGGRTLGKWLAGTRVVSLTGAAPTASQLLARNALRIIDLLIAGIPLLSVYQSPLRQRVGDMMSGTIVCLAAPSLEGSDTGQPK